MAYTYLSHQPNQRYLGFCTDGTRTYYLPTKYLPTKYLHLLTTYIPTFILPTSYLPTYYLPIYYQPTYILPTYLYTTNLPTSTLLCKSFVDCHRVHCLFKLFNEMSHILSVLVVSSHVTSLNQLKCLI